MCATPYREAGYKPREAGQPESKEDLKEHSPRKEKKPKAQMYYREG